MAKATKVVRVADLLLLAAEAAEMLKNRVARRETADGHLSGWHARFAPGRIGSPGSAIPLRFFREYGGLDRKTEKEVVKALVEAQYTEGKNAGGWHVLSVSGTPSVEGTAPTLEALSGTRGNGVGEAIKRGQSWLEQAQSADGGWGSTSGNPSRVYTTALSLLALGRLESPDPVVVDNAFSWLENTQQANGAWGPTPGEPGTPVHTAFAIRALIGAGAPMGHKAVADGMSYLRAHWSPDPKAIQHEAYDFHVGPTYHRVTAVYDIDAEVVSAILAARPSGLDTALWDAVAAWVAFPGSGRRWWERDDDQLTVWTVVPRALAALRIARQYGPGTTTIRWRDDIVTFSAKRGWGPVLGMSLSAVRPSRAWQRAGIRIGCVAVTAAIVALAWSGHLDVQNAIVGVLLPLVLFALQFSVPGREPA